ncbi:MAG TPA: GNAT family protein [Candidatus Limnocylindrales bacterium]|jgi:RimJ/RimL family protein N-acetyltransferase|nr:GNAT family protein [Candidatus Limnocylindrales bacterium]
MPDRPAPEERPVPIIGGRLVYLRPAEREDLPLFVRWLSDARTTQYLALRSPLNQALEERWFDDLLDHHGRDRWHFVICRLEDGRPVGSLDLHALDLRNGNAGIGIVIGDPADTGRGYGSDALAALLDFGFTELRLERLWLDVYDFNERGRHIYERAGFVLEATLRHDLFRGGRFVDVHRMGILREEWSARRAGDGAPES